MRKSYNFKNSSPNPYSIRLVKHTKLNILRILSVHTTHYEYVRFTLLRHFKPSTDLTNIELKQLDNILVKDIKIENIPYKYLRIFKLNKYLLKRGMNLYVFIYLNLYKRYFLKRISRCQDYSAFLLENLEINELCNFYFKSCKKFNIVNNKGDITKVSNVKDFLNRGKKFKSILKDINYHKNVKNPNKNWKFKYKNKKQWLLHSDNK